MRTRITVLALGMVLAASTFAFAQLDPLNSTITGSSWGSTPPRVGQNWNGSGWVPGGQWGTDPGSNGWLSGTGGSVVAPIGPNPVIRTSASSKNWSGMSYSLTGYNKATLSTELNWRGFGGTYSNGVRYFQTGIPGYADGLNSYIGTSLMTMELNGIGVALTIITGQETSGTVVDLNGVNLSETSGAKAYHPFDMNDINNLSNFHKNNDQLIQLVQFDQEGNFKLLDTFDLAYAWNTNLFTGNVGAWEAPICFATLEIDESTVRASFSAVGYESKAWSYGHTVTPMGFVYDQAIWGSGSPIFKAGNEATVGWLDINLNASVVPEPASLCLLALGALALFRRR